jgi:hypothetical protein
VGYRRQSKRRWNAAVTAVLTVVLGVVLLVVAVGLGVGVVWVIERLHEAAG